MKTILNTIAKLHMGAQTKRKSITMPNTRFAKDLLAHLKKHNLIKGYDWDFKSNTFKVLFRHWAGNITHLDYLKLVTRPSNRKYVTYNKMVRYFGKKGHVLISTPHGLFNHRTLLTLKPYTRKKIAGEAIAIIKY